MPNIKLTGTEIGCMATFQSLTRATPKDCVINDDSTITFIVGKNEMGLAIGRKGSNIKNASKTLKKEVEVVEYSDDPVKFINNVMYPIRPKTINIEEKDQKKIAKVAVESRDRAAAIGSRGHNILKIKSIVLRHHPLDDIIIV